MMLQEDFSNQVTFLLSLYATTKLLHQPVIVQKEEEVPETQEEEEEEVTHVFLFHYFQNQMKRFLFSYLNKNVNIRFSGHDTFM